MGCELCKVLGKFLLTGRVTFYGTRVTLCDACSREMAEWWLASEYALRESLLSADLDRLRLTAYSGTAPHADDLGIGQHG